jgi:hypothetical protein
MVCANTTAAEFKVIVEVIKIITKIAIRKVITNLLVELVFSLLLLFFLY